MLKKYFYAVSVIIATMFLASCGALSSLTGGAMQKLSLTDIEPNFGPFGASLQFEGIEYKVIGEQKFDDFFKESAKIKGVIKVADIFSTNTTESLKKTAMDIAANDELKESVNSLVKNKPRAEWTLEELIAVTKLGIQRKKVSTEVLKGYVGTGLQLGTVIVSLNKAVTIIPNLLSTGQELSSATSSLKPTTSPAAVSGLASSMENLKSAAENAPNMIKSLTVMSQAFAAFASM